MTIHLRADRTLFRFSGPDAHRLLNDVLTGIIPTAEDGLAHWWALLSPQGKILAEGSASFEHDALWLDVHASVADDFFKRMRMYRLRAKAEIEDLRDTHRLGYSPELLPGATLDRRGPVELGWRLISTAEDAGGWSTDDAEFHQARISQGILLQGNDFPANDGFAHDIGMDLLEGIDFAKGCYVGQEVVSRMKHRGTARRRPVIVSGIDAPSGSAVLAGTREAGTIGQVIAGNAAAIVRLDRITNGSEITVGDKPIRLDVPAWANYAFGETGGEE